MKFRFILIFTALLLLLASCDRIRATLGMATSADIEAAKKELQEKAAQNMLPDSTINATESVTINNNSNENDEIGYAGSLTKKFYIIIGSFKKESNTRSLLAFLKTQGYEPVKIPLKNGYNMVSLCGYGTYEEARAEVAKIKNKEVCPYDVWIYDINQRLHK
ncbi:MAG: SPOR domain-containing protein [Bacteroidales bacterium]